MPANGTGFGSIARVNKLKWNTMQFRFVSHKSSKLIERPIRMSRSLRLSNPCPIADARQIFHSDTAMGAFSLRNYSLTQLMIRVFLKMRLFAAHLFQSAFSTFRSNRLKNGASFLIPLTLILNLFTTEYFTIRISSDINYAKVNAKPINWIIFVRFNDFTNLVKEKCVFL